MQTKLHAHRYTHDKGDDAHSFSLAIQAIPASIFYQASPDLFVI